MTQDIVLITRPEPDSRDLQHQLSANNIASAIAPTMSIQPAKQFYNWNNLDQYDGVLITSKHTGIYLDQKLKESKLPIFTIGEETLKSLMFRDFKVEETANGNSLSLKKILDEYIDKKGNLREYHFIHFGGVHVSTAFKQHILDSDLKVTHIPLYEAVAIRDFSSETINSLREQKIGLVVFFSSRSAVIFEGLCEKYALTDTLKHIRALCLAPSVVKSLDEAKWKNIITAAEPNSAAMMKSLKETMSQE